MATSNRTAPTIGRRLTTLVLATALTVAALGYAPAGQARRAEDPGRPPADEYVPFVTDFPKPAAPAPVADADGGEIDWAEVGLAGGVGAALVALAGTVLVVARRARPPRTT